MFLSNSTLGEVVKVQVRFKLNAYLGVAVSLIFVQVVGLLFSLNGTSSMGSTINNTMIQIITISPDSVFFFVAIWALLTGNIITTKAYRYSDFSFVTTSLSNNLSNILVLFILSVFAGMTTFLSNYITRVVLLLFDHLYYVKSVSILEDPLHSIVTVCAVICLILAISSAGYLWGMLVQINKIFMFPLILLMISALVTKTGQSILLYIFIENESMLLLLIKLVCVSIIFFSVATVCSNRMEVRR